MKNFEKIIAVKIERNNIITLKIYILLHLRKIYSCKMKKCRTYSKYKYIPLH
jgi:hypothetical protein